jgi:glutathione S-transferase
MKPTMANEPPFPLRVAGVFVNMFSCVGKREPPTPEKSEHIRLISIAVSHYVEKARWGLDLLEENTESHIYYTEDLHPPAFHSFFTLPASKNQTAQTPMIVMPDERVMWGSDAILRELCSGRDGGNVNLYPTEMAEEIKALEDDLGVCLGAAGRRYFAYGCMLDKSKKYYDVAIRHVTKNCSKVEHKIFGKMFDKGTDKALVDLMNISDETVEASAQEMRKVFRELSDRLEQNGGGYLMDTPTKKAGFTTADLTLAALVYFVVQPPQVQPLLLPESEIPPKATQLFRELTATKADQHVLKVYKEHRPVDRITGEIALKKVDQNRNPFKLW